MRRAFAALTAIILFQSLFSFAAVPRAAADFSPKIRKEKLSAIDRVVNKAIRAKQIPGAVVLIGNQDKVIYRKAFGYRSLKPKKEAMTLDTIFDLASLTKVIATTTAVMQLVEKDKLRLDASVAEYWPDFKKDGKENITVRDLLTHYSGLRPDLSLKADWSGYEKALDLITDERPVSPPEAKFVYSDINFAILGELVRRVSGDPLDVFCEEHIFKPLGMNNTFFRPSPDLRRRIAPTQYVHGTKGNMLRGTVHDPTAQRMGGVAGHAGLFSTADDLSIFARMLLNGGVYKGAHILSSLTVEKMTVPQSPPDKATLRGFGWNIDSPLVSNREDLPPVGSCGHTGYTGTSIWIDPVSETYVIILTNRVHPCGKGDVKRLRAEISRIVSSAVGPVSAGQVLADRHSLAGYYEHASSINLQGERNGKVRTGIDVLEDEKFAPLTGLRIGLITNQSGLDSSGQSTLDVFLRAQDVKLAAIFTPEHGLFGKADGKVASFTDPVTDLLVYSLYGNTDRPTEKMLDGLDALVFDIQDAGVRFYTFITTMGYAMEAAAAKGIPFYVLDRPNPITGSFIHGPVIDEDMKSFTGYFSMPVRHGMTIGELANMFNAENKIGAKLSVIKMRGYQRTDWYDETGLPWVSPSPNLRTLKEAVLYPGVAMVEGSNLSVGRGTQTPFELLGSPWINSKKLAAYLNNRKIEGVRFMPVDFTPKGDRYENKVCHGVRIVLVDRKALDPAALGVEIADALHKLFPKDFKLDRIFPLVASRTVFQAIKDGQDPITIVRSWQEPLEEFRKMRSKYLLY